MKLWIESILHLAFWLLCFWLLYSAFQFENVEVVIENGVERTYFTRNNRLLPFLLLLLAAKALLFYGLAFFLLPHFFRQKNWWRLAGQLALLLAGTYLAIYLLARQWMPMGTPIPFGIHLLLYFFFASAAFAYRLSRDWWRNERQRAQLAQEKLATELNYLKAQLNPHFLFNTLNNLYALAEREGNKNLSDGLANLAELMRYVIYDSRSEFVPLSKELRFLQSMLEMQHLRLDEEDEAVLGFQARGPVQEVEIAPLLLVPFVENAVKHGIRHGRPSFVKVEARVDGQVLRFSVSNSLHPAISRPAEKEQGIGLANVRRRLALLYPGRHELHTHKNEGRFSVNLQIELYGK